MAVIVVSYVLDRYMFHNKSESRRLCSEVWKMTEYNYTPQDFTKAREKFRETIPTEKQKMLEKINELKKIKDIEDNDEKKKPEDSVKTSIETAVGLAYNDVKRTLHGIDGKGKEAKSNVISEFYVFFSNHSNALAQSAFDNAHDKLCNAWIGSFDDNSPLGTYGKAQKIVNMTFKYLYCYADDILKERFKYCHMPLDSFTLEWFKRNIQEVDPTKIGSWSKMEDEKSDTIKIPKNKEKYYYPFYVKKIVEFINNINQGKPEEDKLTPLQLEFIIWPQMQLELATENYLFALTDEYKKTTEKEKLRKESLDYKMALVVNTINNFNCKKQ